MVFNLPPPHTAYNPTGRHVDLTEPLLPARPLPYKTIDELFQSPDWEGGPRDPNTTQEFVDLLTVHLYGGQPTKPKYTTLEKIPEAPPTGAESRQVQCVLDGRTIKFTYWRNPQIPLDGPYPFYFFSHCCEDPTLVYQVVQYVPEIGGRAVVRFPAASSNDATYVVSKASGKTVAVPRPPSIVLAWCDDEFTIY